MTSSALSSSGSVAHNSKTASGWAQPATGSRLMASRSMQS